MARSRQPAAPTCARSVPSFHAPRAASWRAVRRAAACAPPRETAGRATVEGNRARPTVARFEQRCLRRRAKLFERALHGSLELGDETRRDAGRVIGISLVRERVELCGRERLAARVREEPIEAPDRVPHVKARRRGTARPRPDLCRRQRSGPPRALRCGIEGGCARRAAAWAARRAPARATRLRVRTCETGEGGAFARHSILRAATWSANSSRIPLEPASSTSWSGKSAGILCAASG